MHACQVTTWSPIRLRSFLPGISATTSSRAPCHVLSRNWNPSKSCKPCSPCTDGSCFLLFLFGSLPRALLLGSPAKAWILAHHQAPGRSVGPYFILTLHFDPCFPTCFHLPISPSLPSSILRRYPSPVCDIAQSFTSLSIFISSLSGMAFE